MPDCHHCTGGGCRRVPALTDVQRTLLAALATQDAAPLARFTDPTKSASTLEPVLLDTAADKPEDVQETGALLSALADAGLVLLDYAAPLSDYAYLEYWHSTLFRAFAARVKAAGGDPVLECGRITLTSRGLSALTASAAPGCCGCEGQHGCGGCGAAKHP